MNLPKTISRRARVSVLLLAMAAYGISVRAAPEAVDPIVGNWLWNQDRTVTFLADGTAHWEKSEGTWQYLHNPEVQRHYRIVWEHGQYIDELSCSEDGTRGHVRNQNKEQYNVRRALDDKPAATPTPAAHVASAVSVAPPLTTNAVDPLVGEWRWLKNRQVIFKADGTMTASNGPQGIWEFLHNPEAIRKYRLDWDHGKYVDNLSYNRTARTAHVVNQSGEEYNVAPKEAAAASGQPADYFGTSGR